MIDAKPDSATEAFWHKLRTHLVNRGVGALSVLDRQIAAVIIALHILAVWAFGSVLWVDASTYIRLAQAFTSAEAMRTVYDGSSLWWHNYVPPGVPLIWLAVRWLPEHAIWPVVAIAQHAASAAALISYVRAARDFVPSRLHALAATLLCVYPYYQAFNNGFGTEAIASSVLLFGFAVLLRALRRAGADNGPFWKLLALMVITGLFRHNVLIVLAGFSVAVAIHQKRLISLPVFATAALAFAAYFGFALARQSVTGEFIAPRPGLSRLYMAPRVNLDPSAEARRTIESVAWPGGLTAEAILTGAFDYAQLEQVARAWRAQGLSNDEVLDRLEELGRRLRHDGWRTEVRAVAHGLVAAGINTPCYMPGRQETYARGMLNAAACDVSSAWTNVFSWMAVDRKLVEQLLAGSFSDASVPDLQLFQRAWLHWFIDGRLRPRDPLFLSWISLTAISVAFLIASIVILRRNVLLGLCLLGAFSVTAYLHSVMPFAGTRYTYPLLPLYVLSVPLAVAIFHRQPVIGVIKSASRLLMDSVSRSQRQMA